MFPCSFCTKFFQAVDVLSLHVKIEHNTKIRSACYCPVKSCFRSFSNFYSYRTHVVRQHGTSSQTDIAASHSHENSDTPKNLKSLDNLDPIPDQIKSNSSSSVLDNSENPLHDSDTNDEFPNCVPSSMLNIEHGFPTSQQTPFTYDETVDLLQNERDRFHKSEIQNFQKYVTVHAAKIVTKLYGNTSISRSVVNEILQDFNTFYGTCIDNIKQSHTSLNKDCHNVNSMLEITKDAFSPFSNEYQTFKTLDESGYLIKPATISVAAILKPRRVKSKIINRVFNISIQFIPIKPVLTNFLELPNVYNSICKFIDSCYKQNSKIKSILQTDLWQDIRRKYEDKTVFPVSLYFDDYEINNPLGTHRGKNKLGAVYYRLNCIPYEYASKLENIFLAQIHNSKNHDDFGNKKIFDHLINEIRDLEKTGITIKVVNGYKTIYFAVVAIQGDNLGLNTILGFVRSFSAMRYCRICSMDKYEVRKQNTEDVELLRDRENYTADVSESANGVSEECVFNKLANFHVINNIIVDVMHDLYEGICRYKIWERFYTT